MERYQQGNEPKIYPGRKNGLLLVLDAHADKLASGTVSDTFRGFDTVIDGKDKYPFISRNGFLIKSGQENQVAISATRFQGHENIRPISPEQRNCYFPDEYPLKLHRLYTQANCFFECKIEYLRKAMHQENKTQSRCVPWFYPVEQEYIFEMCDPWQTKRFLTLLEEMSDDTCETCLPDCSSTEYTPRISSAAFRNCDRTNLGVSPLCELTSDGYPMMNPPIWEQVIHGEYKKFNEGDLPNFGRKQGKTLSMERKYVSSKADAEKLVLRAQNEEKPSYNAFEEDIAIVNFYFDKSSVAQYATFERMTMKDYISQVTNRKQLLQQKCPLYNKNYSGIHKV